MKILVVDDDKDLNRGICTFLESRKIDTVSVFNGREALEEIEKNKFDLILSDFQMPEMNGLELILELKRVKNNIPIIMMTAFSSVENAVESMKNGAEDYLIKPVNLNELLIRIEKNISTIELKKENNELKRRISKIEMPEIIGDSEVVKDLKEILQRITKDHNIPVSIYGKSGTGKELVARNIHFMSMRENKPFLPINCAALSEDLLESELFGHVKGAFTGADRSKEGLLQSVDGGTIFLDEISEMTPRVQSKLLRVLQDGVIQPIGSNKMIKVDVRFISASNQKLSELVAKKKIREDLFYRLNVIEIEVPSLAMRKNDIPILVKHFFDKYNASEKIFCEKSLILLKKYTWPGNIRELENLIRKLLITTQNGIVEVEDLPQRIKCAEEFDQEELPFMEEEYKFAFNKSIINFEKNYLNHHLKKNDFNISKTAEAINLSRVSLHKKIKEYSISLQ